MYRMMTAAFAVLTVLNAVKGVGTVPYSMVEQVDPVNLPELMRCTDGSEVKTVGQWESRRRPELLDFFTKNVYGVRPVERPADIRFVPAAPDAVLEGGIRRKQVRVEFSGPLGKWSFGILAFLPESGKPVPSFVLICNASRTSHMDPELKNDSEFWPVRSIVKRGYAAVAFKTSEIASDTFPPYFENGEARVQDPDFTNDVYACFSPRRGYRSWSAISAWAWGASRVLDWIGSDPAFDASRVAVIGHSRAGKTALWAAASDSRFAMACVNNSGCCGAKLNHAAVCMSETIALDNNVNPHWFCRAYREFNGKDHVLPFDQHWIAALIAPRLLYIASGSRDIPAGPWGEFLTARHASPAWELYGKKGLVEDGPYRMETPFHAGRVGYHLRKGGHALAPYDWHRFMDFADRHMRPGTGRTEPAMAPPPVIVPAPKEMKVGKGTFSVKADGVTRSLYAFKTDSSLQKEGYRLSVTPEGISVAAADEAGRFYAEQTLRQLAVAKDGKLVFPAVEITDSPSFVWRGALLDEGRHFFGKETVKNMLDQMAYHKMNVLHWHLTEDQGWRIDIPGMPELVRYGSWRRESPKHGSKLEKLGNFRYRSELNGQKYGPFYYTEKDLREIVAYAAERHIRVVPEVDIPGHMRSAIAAYPQLTCFPSNITERCAHSDWGISTDVLCIGNDETVAFLEKVFDFVCDVFPSEVIHIGGDECPRINWEKCPKCRARMEKEGFTKAGQLQGWITRKIAARIAKRGRRIMGWDEILADDAPKTAIGHSWRTQSGNGAGTTLVSGAEAARLGYDMVMNPHAETYYDYRQGLEDDPFQYPGGHIPLSRAYAFDPCKGVVPEARKHVLGSQAQMWSEYIWNEYDLAWKMWPRACAMAETLWTGTEKKDFEGFLKRMETHRKRLISMGVNCAPLK